MRHFKTINQFYKIFKIFLLSGQRMSKSVRAAGDAILDHFGLTIDDRYAPEVRTSERITGVDGHQSMLINRMRHGDMIVEGQMFYVFECEPAGYALIAANEAEKAADVRLLEVRSFGAYGRLYLGGYEADIEEAEKAIKACLADIGGRALPRKR